ncbi:hypothetical protein MNBD_GAMMA21-2702 [hydrothermal vent metagenome]|uniref:STAS domain-containing protein n=1 Tax=hydrothermal vent metagenome TaxID=652676 RepID=A0A3B1AIE3_9ZZZZ
MSLQKQKSSDGGAVTIKISGMFDLSIQSEFRDAYESEQGARKYILDMRDTEYMDSSAFGMLLVFRDHVGGESADILIANANDDIKKSFEMLQFDRMFKIS